MRRRELLVACGSAVLANVLALIVVSTCGWVVIQGGAGGSDTTTCVPSGITWVGVVFVLLSLIGMVGIATKLPAITIVAGIAGGILVVLAAFSTEAKFGIASSGLLLGAGIAGLRATREADAERTRFFRAP